MGPLHFPFPLCASVPLWWNLFWQPFGDHEFNHGDTEGTEKANIRVYSCSSVVSSISSGRPAAQTVGCPGVGHHRAGAKYFCIYFSTTYRKGGVTDPYI